MVGIFAGRGDVVIAMLLSGIIGMYLGYQLKRVIYWVEKKQWRKTKPI